MAHLITARQRVQAAAAANGWALRVTVDTTRDSFDRGGRTLRAHYNERGGLVSASLVLGDGPHVIGGGRERIHRVIDALASDQPRVTGPRTWGGAR